MVRNITLSADGDLIERARLRAAQEKNAECRFPRMQRYAGRETGSKEYAGLVRRLEHVRSSGRTSRGVMNER